MSSVAEPDRNAPGSGDPIPTWLAIKALQFVVILGVGSLLVASAALLIYGAVETAMQVSGLAVPKTYAVANRDIFLTSIKLIDLVLLATIMQVVGIGLYSLMIGRQLPVPRWMMIADVDDLKNKLAGIVAVMLGVSFLEQLFYWGTERDLMRLGIGIGVVIVALSYFIRSHPHQ